jgi:ATP-binding cassette subfamily B protein
MKTFKRLFPYAMRYPLLAFLSVFAAILSALLVVVFPATTGRIVDVLVAQKTPSELIPLVLIGLAGFIGQHGLTALSMVLSGRFEQRIVFDLRSDLYSHIQKLPLKWFDNRATGDLMTRLIEDAGSLERMLVEFIEQGIVVVIQIVAVCCLMLYYSPLLTLVVLIPTPLLVLGAFNHSRIAYRNNQNYRSAFSTMNCLIHENIAGIRQIKTYTTEELQHRQFDTASDKLQNATLKELKAWAFYQPSMAFITSCGLLLVSGFGGYQVLQGKLAVGELVSFLVLTNFLYGPVNRIHHLNHVFQAGRAAGERVFEIFDSETEIDEQAGNTPSTILGHVRYSNVCFGYESGRSVLHDIDFEVNSGQMVAIVGPTGSGKSTIVNLLVRFYEFDSGDIDIDGISIRKISKSFLRKNVAIVTQESFLFNGTTAENLRVAKPHASDQELWDVLSAANADAFVQALPEGLNSRLGERGVRLSVGERQRISIARALLKNPPILILDEATASVDTNTERLIQQALERLMADRTSFVIAHRLSTVRHASEILVIDQGRIIERGCHAELLVKNGPYAKLVGSSLV